MAASMDRATQRLQQLAALVEQRRVALRWSKEAAAAAADLAYMTYDRVEAGKRVQAGTYAKVEKALGFAPGSCRAVLGGADAVALADGGELMVGARITRDPLEGVEDAIRQAVTNATIATTPELTAAEIGKLSARVLEELRRQGVLKPPPDQQS